MAPSAPTSRIFRGSTNSDDSRSARTSPVAEDSTRAGGPREVPEAAPRAEALDAKWQSAIDAATD